MNMDDDEAIEHAIHHGYESEPLARRDLIVTTATSVLRGELSPELAEAASARPLQRWKWSP